MPTNIIGPLFVSIVGGLTANFLAKTVWEYYTRPVLSVEDSLDLTFDYGEDGDLEIAHYSLIIKNSGKRPARNCSANMYLDGTTDGIHYHFEGQIPWNGKSGNNHITINPSQSVKLNLFRANFNDYEGMMTVPVDGEWEPDNLGLIAGKQGDKYRPIREYWEGQGNVWPDFGFSSRELAEGNWDTNQIVITSENSGKLKICPNYSHPEGYHGMAADLDSRYTSRFP
jgi:hypothetical protein